MFRKSLRTLERVISIPTAPTKVLLSPLPLPPENPDWGLGGPSFGPKLAPNFCASLSGVLMPLFKTRLRVLRAETECSQAKLAAQVGVTRQTINCIEKGRFHPNLRLTFKIDRTFGKRVSEVVIYDDI
jgi:putative transcriptional regulator